MAIDRTWLTPLADDSGSGTDGSIVDKDLLTDIADAIDGALPATDAAAGTGSLRTLGTSSTSAAAGNDSRLSNARTPSAHAASHASGGTDAIAITEAQVTSLVTDLAAKVGSADSRLSDARTPTTHAASHASGGSDAITITEAQVTSLVTDLAAKVGTGDSRLSDARTPTAHAASHLTGGSDAIKLDDLAAPDDNTDLDASTTKHGLLKKLPGGTSTFLRADGSFATPAGSGDVVGPASSVNARVATFDGTTGKLLADGGVTVAGIATAALAAAEASIIPIALATEVSGDLPLANLAPASSASKLLGRGDSGAGDFQEITLGSGLTMTGTTLAASAGGGGSGDVVGPASAVDSRVAAFDTTTGKLLKDSGITIAGIAAAALAAAAGIKLDDFVTPDDNTDLDASTTKHGLLKKLPGGTSNFLRSDGTFAAPTSAPTILLDGTVHSDTAAGGAPCTAGDIIIGNGSNKWGTLSLSAPGRTLHVNGAGTSVAWALVNVASEVTGDLPFANLAPASAASRLLGRGSASGAGDFEELTLGGGLGVVGTMLGGKVVQIVAATYATVAVSSSSTPADTGLTVTITPTSASNKILILLTQNGLAKAAGNTWLELRLLRGASVIALVGSQIGYTGSSAALYVGGAGIAYLDAPATASAVTYKTTFASGNNLASVNVQDASAVSSIVAIEVTP